MYLLLSENDSQHHQDACVTFLSRKIPAINTLSISILFLIAESFHPNRLVSFATVLLLRSLHLASGRQGGFLFAVDLTASAPVYDVWLAIWTGESLSPGPGGEGGLLTCHSSLICAAAPARSCHVYCVCCE